MTELSYRTNQSALADIESHLKTCNQSFVPPLSHRVNLSEYAEKLATRATRFEAWCEEQLVGLVALYLEEAPYRRVFITNVSVFPECRRAGVAKKLMHLALSFAVKEGSGTVHLNVCAEAHEALELYKKLGFRLIEDFGTHVGLEWQNAGYSE